MQFPRYEFVLPPPTDRLPRQPRPRRRPTRPPRRPRPALRALRARRRSPARLDVQQYLLLEFTVDDRR
jgi:hypothetical protein